MVYNSINSPMGSPAHLKKGKKGSPVHLKRARKGFPANWKKGLLAASLMCDGCHGNFLSKMERNNVEEAKRNDRIEEVSVDLAIHEEGYFNPECSEKICPIIWEQQEKLMQIRFNCEGENGCLEACNGSLKELSFAVGKGCVQDDGWPKESCDEKTFHHGGGKCQETVKDSDKEYNQKIAILWRGLTAKYTASAVGQCEGNQYHALEATPWGLILDAVENDMQSTPKYKKCYFDPSGNWEEEHYKKLNDNLWTVLMKEYWSHHARNKSSVSNEDPILVVASIPLHATKTERAAEKDGGLGLSDAYSLKVEIPNIIQSAEKDSHITIVTFGKELFAKEIAQKWWMEDAKITTETRDKILCEMGLQNLGPGDKCDSPLAYGFLPFFVKGIRDNLPTYVDDLKTDDIYIEDLGEDKNDVTLKFEVPKKKITFSIRIVEYQGTAKDISIQYPHGQHVDAGEMECPVHFLEFVKNMQSPHN